ncbi:732_t:CDS:2, partial [Ambispora gerdemannii]
HPGTDELPSDSIIMKIVCSKYFISSPVKNNSSTTMQSNQARNRLYKGHDIKNLDHAIIKVFTNQSSWEIEKKFLCSLKSKFVIKWLDMEINNHFGFVSVTSYAGENLETKKYIFNGAIAKKQILLSISRAIEFLHGEKVAHLDLKLSNIICKPNNPYKIRLCDFESAKNFGDYLQSDHFCSCGFSAPEIVQHATIKVGSAQDIFSLGCIFYFIHKNMRIYDAFDDLRNSTCFDHRVYGEIVDEQAANITLRMLDWNPNDRPTIQKVIDSDYFK